MENFYQFLKIDEQLVDARKKLIVSDQATKQMLVSKFSEKLVNVKVMSERELKALRYEPLTVTQKKFIYDNSVKYFNFPIKDISLINRLESFLHYVDSNEQYESKQLQIIQALKQDLQMAPAKSLSSLLSNYQIINLCPITDVSTTTLVNTTINPINVHFNNPSNATVQVAKYDNIYLEINEVCNEICRLIVSGVNINDIFVYLPSSNYQTIFANTSRMFNIRLANNNPKKIINTKAAKIILNDIKLNKFDSTLESYELFDPMHLNKIINILNKYSDFANDYSQVLAFIKYDFETNSIPQKAETNVIQTIDPFNSMLVDQNQIVFILGANEGLIPNVRRDDDFLSDLEKSILNIETSTFVNNQNRIRFLNLMKTDNIFTSFALSHLSTTYEPSSIILDNKDVVGINSIKTIKSERYSKEADALIFAKELENYRLYNTKSPIFEQLAFHYNQIQVKDSSFTTINENHFQRQLSHTSINTFYQCQYKFYLQNIVRINRRSKNMSIITGNIIHLILEKCLNPATINNNQSQLNTDLIANIISEYVTEYTERERKRNKQFKFDYIDNFYFAKLPKMLLPIIEAFITENEQSDFKIESLEKTYQMQLDAEHQITLIGKTDKITSKINDDQIFIEIYDYKTGNAKIDLSLVEFGFEMQNLIYFILYQNEYQHEAGSEHLAGVFRQKIKPAILKDDEEQISNFEISGYATSKDEYIFHRAVKKDLLTDQFVKELIDVVQTNINSAVNAIINNDFRINPKLIDKDNKSCTFCDFFEICNKQTKDFVTLQKEKNEK